MLLEWTQSSVSVVVPLKVGCSCSLSGLLRSEWYNECFLLQINLRSTLYRNACDHLRGFHVVIHFSDKLIRVSILCWGGSYSTLRFAVCSRDAAIDLGWNEWNTHHNLSQAVPFWPECKGTHTCKKKWWHAKCNKIQIRTVIVTSKSSTVLGSAHSSFWHLTLITIIALLR